MYNYFVNFILLSESWFIPELFMAISTLFLICYGLFSYNPRLLIIQKSTINLTLLVLVFCLLFLMNFNHFYDSLKLLQTKSCFFTYYDPSNWWASYSKNYYNDELISDQIITTPWNINRFFYSFTGFWSSPFFNNSRLDALSYFFKVLIVVSSILCLVMFKDFVSTSKINFFEYSVIILLCLIGSLVICSANDFLTVYVAIELQSLALYVLAAFKRKSFSSIESGLKYFVLGAFSSGFFLFGVSLLYGLLGTLNFEDIAILTEDNNNLDFSRDFLFDPTHSVIHRNEYHDFSINYGSLMNKIVLFVLLSLLFKLALAPFHAWSPDIYENSPTSSSFFFSVVTKLSILALFLKLYCIYFSFINYNWKYIITIIGVVSILVGCIGGVDQRKIKTLLAYSSISHLGYITLSLSCDSPVSLQMSLSYTVLYVLSSLSVWSIFFFVNLKKTSNLNKHNKDLGDLSLLKKSNILLAICFSTYLFSIAGIPPLAGFLAKVNIFLTLLHHESMLVISLLSLIGSVISTFLYIRVIKILFFETVFVGRLYLPIKKNTPVILAVFLILPLLIFTIPNTFYCLTEKFSVSVLYPAKLVLLYSGNSHTPLVDFIEDVRVSNRNELERMRSNPLPKTNLEILETLVSNDCFAAETALISEYDEYISRILGNACFRNKEQAIGIFEAKIEEILLNQKTRGDVASVVEYYGDTWEKFNDRLDLQHQNLISLEDLVFSRGCVSAEDALVAVYEEYIEIIKCYPCLENGDAVIEAFNDKIERVLTMQENRELNKCAKGEDYDIMKLKRLHPWKHLFG